MMKVMFWLMLALAVLGCGAPAMASEEAGTTQLARLVNEAQQNNPDLQAARDRWEMTGHKVVPAQTLEDPMLGFAFSNYPVDTLQPDQTPMTGNELRISQNFPFPGKLAAKGEVAEQQALWNKAAYEDARLQLARQVKDGYYRLYFQDRAIAVTEENLAILGSFVSLTKTRYEVGKGLQQDLLKAQVEQSKLLDKLLALRQQRSSTLAALNRLLARPADTPLELSADPQLVPVGYAPAELQHAAREHRPMFAAFRSLMERYVSQRKLAKLDSYPNFNLWASYRFRDDGLADRGTDFVSAGVGLTLPIWREKRAEEVAEADSGIRMARRQLEDFGNQVDAGIRDLYAQLDRNHDQAQLFATGIIPQAQQAFDASLTAYQVGKVEFLNLLDGLMTLYRYQLDYQRALADYQRNLAGLEAAAGVDPTGTATSFEPSTNRTEP